MGDAEMLLLLLLRTLECLLMLMTGLQYILDTSN